MKLPEEWKTIPEYKKYEISNYGNVRIAGSGKHRRPFNNGGYKRVRLFKAGVGKHRLIHRLTAEGFVANPNSLPFINHKDGDRANNYFDNLEWCTQAYNVQHSFDVLGKQAQRGSSNGNSTLKESDVNEIRKLYSTKQYSQRKLAKMFQTSQRNVLSILKNRAWMHLVKEALQKYK